MTSDTRQCPHIQRSKGLEIRRLFQRLAKRRMTGEIFLRLDAVVLWIIKLVQSIYDMRGCVDTIQIRTKLTMFMSQNNTFVGAFPLEILQIQVVATVEHVEVFS